MTIMGTTLMGTVWAYGRMGRMGVGNKARDMVMSVSGDKTRPTTMNMADMANLVIPSPSISTTSNESKG